MGLELIYEAGQTPINEEEKESLLQKHITTQGELNEVEQLNIEEAVHWTLKRKLNTADILSEDFIRKLHKRMYKDVWRWAGEFRQSDKNIGVDWKQVPIVLRQLVDDCRYWIENETYIEDEIAVRFKHRIVSIHCFPNGNGRHSRLMADVIVSKIFGKQVFTWGQSTFTEQATSRNEYLVALREADKGDLKKLVGFARG